MIYTLLTGEQVEGPDTCAQCGKPLLPSPLYHTLTITKQKKTVGEGFCDAQCSLNWYEKERKHGK